MFQRRHIPRLHINKVGRPNPSDRPNIIRDLDRHCLTLPQSNTITTKITGGGSWFAYINPPPIPKRSLV